MQHTFLNSDFLSIGDILKWEMYPFICVLVRMLLRPDYFAIRLLLTCQTRVKSTLQGQKVNVDQQTNFSFHSNDTRVVYNRNEKTSACNKKCNYSTYAKLSGQRAPN